MKKQRDNYYLDKIIQDLSFIDKYMKDVNKQELTKNELLLDSMLFRLIQISENAERLSLEFKEALPDVPWFQIKGLRNRIVHDYGQVDLTIVYDTLKEDIPELLDVLSCTVLEKSL